MKMDSMNSKEWVVFLGQNVVFGINSHLLEECIMILNLDYLIMPLIGLLLLSLITYIESSRQVLECISSSEFVFLFLSLSC